MELTPSLRAEVFPQHNGGHRVYLRGELDLLSRDELLCALDALHGPVLILDLADLSFVDASGIGVLVELRRRAEQRGEHVVVAGAIGLVQRVFDLLNLNEVFAPRVGDLVPPRPEAVRGVESP